MKENDDLDDLDTKLWTASCQLRALGELLMFQKRQPALDEEDVCHGYGSLIRDIGERMAVLSKLLGEEQVKKAKEPSDNP